jgi:hypothetical protein
MKVWAFTATILLLGISVLIPVARAQPQPKPPKTVPFRGSGGRDISQSPWQSWQAPVGTVDPERLISNDPSNSAANAAVPFKSDSFQAAKPIQVEEAKPIERIESESPDSTATTPAVLATTAQKPKSDSKRIITIAIICVAALAYRKFRRANASRRPPKPNFL